MATHELKKHADITNIKLHAYIALKFVLWNKKDKKINKSKNLLRED